MFRECLRLTSHTLNKCIDDSSVQADSKVKFAAWSASGQPSGAD